MASAGLVCGVRQRLASGESRTIVKYCATCPGAPAGTDVDRDLRVKEGGGEGPALFVAVGRASVDATDARSQRRARNRCRTLRSEHVTSARKR
jgi:hypothetical protein